MEMRKLLNITRGTNNKSYPSCIKEKKELSIRDTMNLFRNYDKNKYKILMEKVEDELGDKVKSPNDQGKEEDKMSNYFSDLNISFDFIPLEVYQNGIFWGGTIDGQLQFVYKVTGDEETTGFDVNYLDGFDASNPENDDIVKRIENYFDIFFKYWRDNVLK